MNARAAAGGGDPAAVARAQILDWARGQKTRPRLVVGFSGGLDSSVLLRALAPLSDRFFLLARHVHHGQRREADDWAEFCARQCARLGIDCEILRVAPGRAVGEEKLRQARYAALAQPAGGRAPDAIAVAHHLDDQAETTLFRLFRGGGARGWAAMRSVAPTPGAPTVALLRPFLEIEKSDLRACARARGIDFVEDEDNRNLARARNALRAEVLPAARARFPTVLRRLGRFQPRLRRYRDDFARASGGGRAPRAAFWRRRNGVLAASGRGAFAQLSFLCADRARGVRRPRRDLRNGAARFGGRARRRDFFRPRRLGIARLRARFVVAARLAAPARAGLRWARIRARGAARTAAIRRRFVVAAGGGRRRLERGRSAAGRGEVARGDGDFAPARGGGNNRFRRGATATKSARIVARGEDPALATRAFSAAGGGRTNRRRAGDRDRPRLPRDGASDRNRNRDAIRFPRRISARRGALKDPPFCFSAAAC